MDKQPASDECDFGRLFVQFQPRIYGFIRSLVPHRSDAEDLLQETASVLWRRFDEFQPGSSFLAWALQVARFQVMYFRQRQSRSSVVQFSDRFLDAVIADTVTESARLGDLQELLEQCMGRLSSADRGLFELRYRSDLPTKSLAEQLGRPASTVYNAISRIRRALAECVEQALRRAGRTGSGDRRTCVTADPQRISELYELANASCDGALSAEQAARLEELVLGDDDLRRRYIVYVQLHAQAERDLSVATPGQSSGAEIPAGAPLDSGFGAAPGGSGPAFFVFQPRSVFQSALGGVALSYAVAALLLGIGLLAAGVWRAAEHGPPAPIVLAGPSDQPLMPDWRVQELLSPDGSVLAYALPINCFWAHPKEAATEMRQGIFDLASGLMEITYPDSGAKILLGGPVTYVIDSPRSGILANGKLMFRLANKPSREELLAHPLFRIRAPTLTVTDRGGAELGIEVDRTPMCHVAVFSGKADVQLANRPKATRTLCEDDSVFVRLLPNHGLEVHLYTGMRRANELFARQLPKFPAVASQEKKRPTAKGGSEPAAARGS